MKKLHEGVSCFVLIFKVLTVTAWTMLLYLTLDWVEAPERVWTVFWIYITVAVSQTVVSAIYELAKKQYEEEKLKEAMEGINRIAKAGGVR